ncbi:Cell cycle checkpoint protein rad17 [Dipsacomyces acuminosporus]|nr:Cell cycle checkpoint protein rad17 [Dipsacomyces acuminosporus]
MVDILDSSRIAESRYASLDVFHALGKVLYAKRERPGAQNDNSGEGRGRLESNPDEVLDRLPMDMSTFGLYIHEGYTDFCTSIDEAAQISSHLSDADTVSGSKGARRAGNAFATTAEVYSAMLTARGFMHAKGHPLLAGEDDQSSSNSTQDRYRRHMNPFRKPQFFDSYKQRVLNSKLSDDPVAAEILTAGGLTAAGLLATRQGFTQHILPYWADISAHGQSGMHFQQRYPAMYRQLMYLAMVSSDAVASQQLQTLAISQNSGQVAAENAATEQGGLVLSDDDIDDFSD